MESEREGGREETRENVGEGGSEGAWENKPLTTERNASSFSSVVGAVVKREFASKIPASITTETSASPLLSVDGAGAVGAGGGGVKSRAIVFVESL